MRSAAGAGLFLGALLLGIGALPGLGVVPPAAGSVPVPAASVGPAPPPTVAWSSNVSVGSGVSVGVALTASVLLPSGSIDAGTALVRPVALKVPSDASLEFDVLGARASLPVPALGGLGPIEVPGLNYTYYGVDFRVYAEVATEITANCSSEPALSGCGPGWTWTSTAARNLTLRAPPSSAVPAQFRIGLSDLAYTVALNLTARGTVPFLGNVTVPIGAPRTLASFSASPQNLSSVVNVTALPAISSASASPASVVLGDPLALSVRATGGSGPLRFTYLGLPGGCASANTSTLSCRPNETGSYPVRVVVTDAQGVSAAANVSVTVQAPGGTDPASGPFGPTPYLELGVVLAIGAAVVGLGTLGWSRRRRERAERPMPSPSGPTGR